jgi:hypothetical protein
MKDYLVYFIRTLTSYDCTFDDKFKELHNKKYDSERQRLKSVLQFAVKHDICQCDTLEHDLHEQRISLLARMYDKESTMSILYVCEDFECRTMQSLLCYIM